jgi:thioredoxin-related protein
MAAQSQTIPFIDNDWNKARAEAKQQNKYLFVDAYTDWCYWCKVMDKNTFPDKDVIAFMNEKFIPLKLEMEHKYGVNVARKYRVSGFPSFLIFSADGKLIRQLAGYIEPVAFLDILKQTLNTKEYPGYAGISTNVDLAFPDFYKKSFTDNGKRDKTDSATVNNYLANQKDFFSEVNYSVMVRFASLLNEKNQSLLFENKKKYVELFGKGDIDNAVYSVGNSLLDKSIKNKSESDLITALKFIEKHQTENAEDTRDLFRLSYYKGTENWRAMANEVDVFIAKNGHKSDYLNDWSWTVYEKCDDEVVIKKAIEWMGKVIDEKPEYATMDTYAALLFKGKQTQQAKIYAQKAIDIGKAAGEKTDETEKLLKEIEAVK